jgi:hypothetical protein
VPTKTFTPPKTSAVTESSSLSDAANEPGVTELGVGGTETALAVHALLARFGLTLKVVGAGQLIPGTFWGAPEAGLIGSDLFARADTPLHSVLHEACHYICMSRTRREAMHTNAGGTALEECAVCYLSIKLAGQLADFGAARMLIDMDRWGYSFRLGSAATWFKEDANDAAQWLREHALLDSDDIPTWKVRD